MKRLTAFSAAAILASPNLALAVEHNASYQGIAQIYFVFIAATLIYGVYDSFGKTAMYVAAPVILGWCYWMLPPA